MTVVAALGGNALLRRGHPPDPLAQRVNAHRAAQALAAIARDHDLIVAHGNGPQVGLLALQSAPQTAAERAIPLDVLGAESEGMIGYLLTQELGNALPGREVATLLTQVVVAADDPSFARPTKPIGPVYATEEESWAPAHAQGWVVGRDGPHWRRVVPSPQPREIIEVGIVRRLVDAGVLVICAGGGGVPVVRRDGVLEGIEAVVDKDRTAALLAETLGADALILLTDVDGIQRDWGTADAERLERVPAGGVDQLHLPVGSMGPKAHAAAAFAQATGGIAAIGRLEDAAAVLAGTAGTRVV
jgi:carbamate kinase